MALKFSNKKNKRIIIILIAIIVIIAIAAGVKIYQNENNKIYGGEGIYYYQQDNNKTLHFEKDKNFSYSIKTDENTAEISKGTWEQSGNEITLTYESGETFKFAKTSDGFIYRKDRVFEGKPSDKKLWNCALAYKEDGKVVKRLWFMDDGTVDLTDADGKIEYSGTYTIVDNVIIIRYVSKPDSYNKKVEVAERYLILDNGITKEVYGRNPVENVAR